MAVLLRLPTRDRLASWGLAVPLHCVLCNSGDESHHHLHFQCPFVASVWAHFCGNSILIPPTSFLAVDGLLSQQHLNDSPGLRSVVKLVMQAIVYCSWRERNSRIFQQVVTPAAGIIAQVHRLLRDRLISIRQAPFRQPRTAASSLLQVYLSLLPSGL
ncbi:hypothetical protein Bca4012_027921 [Brassica carinata]